MENNMRRYLQRQARKWRLMAEAIVWKPCGIQYDLI